MALLAIAIAVVAFLYSSVGHAGASGYIATMTLAGCAAATIRPTALVLNIVVACITAVQFWRAGHFEWRLFWPFAVLSVPAAFLGGWLDLPTQFFKPLVGTVLLLSAARLVVRQGDPPQVTPPAIPTAVGVGAGIGFVSGLTGTGGGIFLTPLMLALGWAPTRVAAATSAVFILVNSIAGLAGYVSSSQPIPSQSWSIVAAAIAGGAVGSTLGSQRFHVRTISMLLALVLVIAGCKLILS